MTCLDEKNIPKIFLGTAPVWEMGNYRFRRLRTVRAVSCGIKLGYGIDCAVAYGNHHQVRNGIRLSGKKREDIFLTSKLYNNQQDDYIAEHYNELLKELQVEFVDLLLLHWPQTSTYINAWKQMEQLHADGKVRYIGIANIELRHLQEMEKKCHMFPQMIQVERNPLNTQEELMAYCEEKKIIVQAYAPLGRMNQQLLKEGILCELSKKYHKTIPQIILRWHNETNVIPVVRSARTNRICDNYDIWDFRLEKEEIEEITKLNVNYKIYDPRKYARYY